ncbi:WD repeat-containing protein 73 isoform X2 [Bufo bufo]|uniref:WD repeat-containing protein 73 isoform X2 n=1 Tax=Bufo bufo TaxID=8384 RepID=UPI001ABE7EFF|nr:WD repeat-containing protein 73 isoform X2 [Bufo bufo]
MASEECEDWILESIKLYKDLHDFELQEATRVIEWTGDKSICIAGYTGARKNEVLQLLFPQKLHEQENQGLCPERDLKVEYGGFSEHPVYSLRHIPNSSLLVTSGPAAAHVQIWQIGAEDKAVSGGEAVGSLSFLDSSTVHLCCQSGRQILADVRQPGIASEGAVAPRVPSDGQWCAAVKPENQGACAKIASLSSKGHITITDTRDLGAPLKCAKTKSSNAPAPVEHMMCVCWAPGLEDHISVSGLDGTVQIYDTGRWDAAVKEVDALFTHRGHSVMGECEDGSAPRVTVHSWHPWKERTLVSAANDGSLHIWDWLDGNAQR